MNGGRHAISESKSSNNAIPLKTAKKNKNTLSSVDVTPGFKKRGTSDRRIFKSPLRSYDPNSRRKPPPKPRPGQKKLLTKSTTGTQYTDVQERKTKGTDIDQGNHKADIESIIKNNQGKYKSRVLNRKTNNINDQFIVLQSMKEMVQTPSHQSSSEVTNTRNDRKRQISIRDIIGNNLRTEVIDAKRENEKKMIIQDEPDTIASKVADESEKKLYNLFVDILENTFNAYDLKDDGPSDSDTALEINESIAKKLTIDNKVSNEYTRNKNKDIKEEKYKEIPINIKLSEHKTFKPVKPKISVKSDITETHRYNGKRKYFKNKRKNVLLNIFKKELKLEPILEQPVTLYEALKIMAKNKIIKREKTRQIKTSDNDKSVCLLKRRKIINMNTYRDNKDSKKIVKYSVNNSKLKKPEKTPVIPSNHSIEVYEYNFDEPEIPKSILYKNKYQDNDNENDTLAKSPSPFVVQSNYDYYTLLKFPDRSTYDFMY